MLSEIWRKKSESDTLLRVNMAFTFYKVFVCLFLFYFVFFVGKTYTNPAEGQKQWSQMNFSLKNNMLGIPL